MSRMIATFAAIAGILMVLLASSALAADLVTIRFSHDATEDSPKGKMATHFRNMVVDRLHGQVEVEVYPKSQLLGDKNEIEAVLRGEVQIVVPALSKFEEYTKQLQIFDLPFLFKDINAVDKFSKSKKGIALLRSMETKGVVGLGYFHNGLKQFTCSSLLRIPADANGLKFAVKPSDILVAQFQAVFATPIKTAFSEIFPLLQTKAIDGQEGTFSHIYSQQLHEVQSYITESNHGVLNCMVVTSIDFWKSMSEPVRTEVKKTLDEAITYGNSLAITQELADRQRILDSKRSKMITLTEAERSQWIEVMKPVWLHFEEEIGKDMIDEAYRANM